MQNGSKRKDLNLLGSVISKHSEAIYLEWMNLKSFWNK